MRQHNQILTRKDSNMEEQHPLPKSKSKNRFLDRFIPNRNATNNEFNSYCLSVKSNLENLQEGYNKIITQNILKRSRMEEQKRIICYKDYNTEESSVKQVMYQMITKKKSGAQKQVTRKLSLVPQRILDAPQIRDDYYLNLLDWNYAGKLGIALNNKVYLYSVPDKISQLCQLQQGYICSVSFHSRQPILAVGNSLGQTRLYDLEKEKQIRTLFGHYNRVSSLSYSGILFSGSKDSTILGHDTKISNNIVMKLQGHKGQVCGLKQDPCGLASGSNDNSSIIWDINMCKARFTLQGHKAAVKALAWCPWQRNLLATGGGSIDKTMRFWNIQNGKCINTINTESQVSSLIWNKNQKEILSSHGHSNNQLCVWKYPQFTKIAQLHSHTQRVLQMALSPDQTTVCSASADQTLRFWKVFNNQTKQQKKHSNSLYANQCFLR